MRAITFYLSFSFFLILFSAIINAQIKTADNSFNKSHKKSEISIGRSDSVSINNNIELSMFRQRISTLYDNIKNRTMSKSDLVNELDAMMREELSKEAEFADLIYIQLPQLLQEWKSGNYILYSVKPGDCLWNIANMYKNGYTWPKIFEANKEVISDPDVIYPSQLIKIPKSFISNFTDTTITVSSDSLDMKTKESESIQKEYSKADQDTIKTTDEDIEIEGMIIDETLTKLGKDFYDLFYAKWQAPEGVKNFSLTIMERPGPYPGTQVSIKVNDLDVYQNFLQPKYDQIEEIATQAVQDCSAYLANYKEIKKELQGEDLQGTGIH